MDTETIFAFSYFLGFIAGMGIMCVLNFIADLIINKHN